MNPEFWHDRWQRGEVGWHKDSYNTYLLDCWPSMHVEPGSRVLVPLCGKTRDMLWLAGEGYRVLGVELSPLAVEAFFQESRLEPVVVREESFQRYSADEIEILCGNFFDLAAAQLSDVRAVYDRAALIALPPEMRPTYVEHLTGVLPSHVSILLVTLDYPPEQMQGPPFSVSDSELRALFSDDFDIELLLGWDALEENPRFRDRGLNRLTENVYVLHGTTRDSS